jgi:hypothetical protein
MVKFKKIVIVLLIFLVVILLIFLFFPVLPESEKVNFVSWSKDWFEFFELIVPFLKAVSLTLIAMILFVFVLHKASHAVASVDSVIRSVRDISDSYNSIFVGNRPKNLDFLTNEGLELCGKLHNGVYSMSYKSPSTGLDIPIYNLESALTAVTNQDKLIDSFSYLELIGEFTKNLM